MTVRKSEHTDDHLAQFRAMEALLTTGTAEEITEAVRSRPLPPGLRQPTGPVSPREALSRYLDYINWIDVPEDLARSLVLGEVVEEEVSPGDLAELKERNEHPFNHPHDYDLWWVVGRILDDAASPEGADEELAIAFGSTEEAGKARERFDWLSRQLNGLIPRREGRMRQPSGWKARPTPKPQPSSSETIQGYIERRTKELGFLCDEFVSKQQGKRGAGSAALRAARAQVCRELADRGDAYRDIGAAMGGRSKPSISEMVASARAAARSTSSATDNKEVSGDA